MTKTQFYKKSRNKFVETIFFRLKVNTRFIYTYLLLCVDQMIVCKADVILRNTFASMSKNRTSSEYSIIFTQIYILQM